MLSSCYCVVLLRRIPHSIVRRGHRSVKYLRDLLKRVALRLREEEPSDGEGEDVEAAEEGVVVPPDIVERDRVDKGQDDERPIHREQLHRQALAAQRVGEYLRRIAKQERRVGNIVVEVEEEDKGDDGAAQGGGFDAVEDGGAGRPDDEGDEHANAGPEKQRAAAEAVHEQGCARCDGEVEDLKQAVDQGLRVGIRDADGVEDEGEIVRHDSDALFQSSSQ